MELTYIPQLWKIRWDWMLVGRRVYKFKQKKWLQKEAPNRQKPTLFCFEHCFCCWPVQTCVGCFPLNMTNSPVLPLKNLDASFMKWSPRKLSNFANRLRKTLKSCLTTQTPSLCQKLAATNLMQQAWKSQRVYQSDLFDLNFPTSFPEIGHFGGHFNTPEKKTDNSQTMKD